MEHEFARVLDNFFLHVRTRFLRAKYVLFWPEITYADEYDDIFAGVEPFQRH